MRVGPLAAAFLALAAAGCGSSPDEQHAAWRSEVDAICGRAERTIREREAARDGGDLQRLVVAVRDDVSAAVDEIREVEIPDGSRRRVSPFLAELGRVKKRVDAIERTAREPKAIRRQAHRLRLEALDLTDEARRAGLERCARAGQGDAAADAVQMPVYAYELAADLERYIRGIAHVERTVGPARGSRLQRARFWEAAMPVISRARYGFDESAPMSIDDRAEELGELLFNLLWDAEELPGTLYSGRPGFGGPAAVARRERKALRMLAKVQRDGIALLEATGAPGRVLLPGLRRLAGERTSGDPS